MMSISALTMMSSRLHIVMVVMFKMMMSSTTTLMMVVAVAAASTTTKKTEISPPPPHIILMLIDDMGWYNAPWNGNLEIQQRMPFLYELATHQGVILDRHYSYKYCSPARSSLLSGRLPIHVTQNNRNNLIENPGGVDLRMKLLPELLKLRSNDQNNNYFTSCIGKWHAGARSDANLPTSRGFDHHFGFLKGGEDHFYQITYDGDKNSTLLFTDLYGNDSPAYGRNGTYSTYLYASEAVKVIEQQPVKAITATNPDEQQNHNKNKNDHKPYQKPSPHLFMYLAWQVMHTPLEAPPEFIKTVPNDSLKINKQARAKMNGMGAILDEGVRNVTLALQKSGLWDNTLLIVSSDNGGWITRNLGGNNYPLRGGKQSDFEGGVRTAAFLSGGYLQKVAPHLVGTRSRLLIHIADWYATLIGLAGGGDAGGGDRKVLLDKEIRDDDSPYRHHDGIPPVDSKDFWKALTDPHLSNKVTAVRKEIPLSYCNEEAECDFPGRVGDAALISWPWKIINGTQGGLGVWQGPQFPNSTDPLIPKPDEPERGCPTGCLFNIEEDPTEHFNVKDEHPDIYERLWKRLLEIGQGVYQTNYDGGAKNCIPVMVAYKRDKGFLAPRCSTVDEGEIEYTVDEGEIEDGSQHVTEAKSE